jgi:hypothetical protein
LKERGQKYKKEGLMPLLNALLGNYRKAEHLLDKHPNLKIRLRRGSREGA